MQHYAYLGDDKKKKRNYMTQMALLSNIFIFSLAELSSAVTSNNRIHSKMEATSIGSDTKYRITSSSSFFLSQRGDNTNEPSQHRVMAAKYRERLGLAAAVMLQHLLCEKGGEMRLGFATYQEAKSQARPCAPRGTTAISPQRQSAQCKNYCRRNGCDCSLGRFISLG